ncbi:hypothetical protein [Marinobacterium aestuariivivens]|uniref:Peptidyl-prolyl cis-trans isomerase n=1 Tax=Marinobacterium aestuariivivens TaxID=1698799 RepID=A0ABW2A8J5_9GAMM
MRVLFGALTSALREPLAHFLLVGVLLFLVHEWWQDRHARDAILVTPERVAALSAGFSRIRQRPPSERELAALIDGYVREEFAVREARALELDRDDSLIRARLRHKLEFLTQDSASAQAPTERELRDWYARNPDAFRTDPELAFRQIFLDPARHPASLDRYIERLLKLLREEGAMPISGPGAIR